MSGHRIPLEDFFRKPERVSPRLSPGGGHLAWLQPWERRLNLFVRDLATGDERRLTDVTERDLAGYLWVDDRHLVYGRDRDGDENHRLYSVARDGSNPRDLTPFDEVKCMIVDELEEQDGMLLFQMNHRDKEVFDVYRLDVRSGGMDVIAQNPGNVESWMTDHDGKLRLAVTTDGVNKTVLFRDREEDEWAPVATYTFKESAHPLCFTFDNRAAYVSSNVGRDRRAILEYDLKSGREGAVVFEHDEVDVDSLLWSRRRKVLTGVAFETDRPQHHFLDDERRALQEFLDAELPEATNRLVSYDRSETQWIVHSGSDRARGSYWHLDWPARKLTHLFDLSPWLDPDALAEMRPIRYEARDGLAIHGYLTAPPGRPARDLPLVVHPHGGPWVRDSWGFNPVVQFLANRGFAVLQMNYRGSAGYGRGFLEAGFGEWGLAMQDDVTDGAEWAVAEGIAARDRVGIFGGSYGGYATLSGLTRTPELYACGVSFVGVSNLFTWIEAFPPYWKPYLEMIHEMVGHPERDEQRFRKTSPLFHVDRIRAPLFVAQGANDPRVRKEESDQIVAALEERGVPVEYLVKENEGHGFQNEENTFDFYRAMESFLDRHLHRDAP